MIFMSFENQYATSD